MSLSLPTPPWVKEPFLNCPCGSGLPFKNCCRDTLGVLGHQTNIAAITPALRRAELARYITWVFQHTQPLLEAGVPTDDLPLANIDLHAITSLADHVAFDMKSAISFDVLSFFSRLQQYLDSLPGLSDAILTLKAAWLWLRSNDEEACRTLLQTLHGRDLSSVTYAPLLELYLDFFNDIPVTRQLNVVERILELHNRDVLPSSANLLHYALLKGLLFLMLGDNDALATTMDKAVKQHLAIVERINDAYALNVAAMTHELMWHLFADPTELGAAIEIRQRLLKIPGLRPSGREAFNQSLGMLLAECGAYSDAVQHLQEAGDSAGALANLADAYFHLGRVDDADNVLRRIDRRGLGEAMRLECLSGDALVATARGDLQRVETLIAQARSLELPDLYFQRTRDQLCIALLEFANQDQPTQRRAVEKQVRGILGWIRYLSQFVELKPNVSGIGLNLNRLIEGPSKH
jgi:tetratricopeptide (TPR) repeat protein